MAKNDDEVKVDNRVIYVEPNDNYLGKTRNPDGSVRFTPLTPPLEDMCVSFNLTVDVHKRFKSNTTTGISITDDHKPFGISWNSGDKLVDHFPFLSGVPMGGKNAITGEQNEYLTTYYTRISQDEYGNISSDGKPSIIEGLGVASVDISYESWYTPTVVIKFVDVRGSALFGVEEAIHNPKGELTADNVFGCLFTVPYPLFRLQVKGYLGKPVTYQLTCSDCRGELNAKTGDFEITATFIGYSYNLLTDISMDFIIAAPYDKHFGESYWESKKYDPDWAMSNGQPPMRLAEMFDKIKAAELGSNGGSISEEESDELNSVSEKIQGLTDIIEAYKAFLDTYKSYDYPTIEGKDANGKLQCVFFKGDSQWMDNFDAPRKYEGLVQAVNKYIEIDSSVVKLSDLPDETHWNPRIECKQIFQKDGNGNVTITGVGSSKLTDKTNLQTNLAKVQLNGGKKLNSTIVSLIDKAFIDTIKSNTVYAYIIDVGIFISNCESKRTELETTKKNLESELEHRRETMLIDSLDFYPTIGNVFKVIMCHLETFVHIMMNAGEEIYGQMHEGLRKPDRLGISLTDTDIPPEKYSDVCPWPAVYGKGKKGMTGDVLDTNDYKAWVGDFSDKFTEIDVIKGFASAIMAIQEQTSQNEAKDIVINSIPVAPCDLVNGNPFMQTADKTSLPDLSYHLTVRCMQLFGVMYSKSIGTDFIEAMGKADAVNYFEKFKTIYGLNNDIVSAAHGTDIRNIVKGIALCDPTYDGDYAAVTSQRDNHTAYKFETQRSNHYTNIPRQPLMVEDGDDYKFSYSYMQADDGKYFTGFSPIPLSDYNSGRHLKYATDGKDRFYMQQKDGKVVSCLSATDSSTLAKYGATEAIALDRFVNSCSFTIIRDDIARNNTEATAIDKRYEELAELNDISLQHGTIKGDFFQHIDDHLLRWKDGMTKYLSQNNSIYPTYVDMGVSCSSLSKDSNGKVSVTSNNALAALLTKSSTGSYSTETKDSVWTCDGNETDYNDGVVWQNRFYTNGTSNFASLFGHPMFYMQNDNRNDVPEADKQMVRKYSKALLILCTQTLNSSNISLDMFKSDKGSGGVYVIPYGYAALLGGLLWRSRCIDKYRALNSNFVDVFHTSCAGYTGLKYKRLVVDRVGSYMEYLPYITGGGNILVGGVIVDSEANRNTNYAKTVCRLFGSTTDATGTLWWPDCNIMNQLIEVFKDFANQYQKILIKYELRHSTATAMDIAKFMERMNAIVVGNDGNIVLDMTNIEGNYVYIAKASSNVHDGLRMLYDTNDVSEQNHFKAMYGNKVVIGDGVRYKLNYNSGGALVSSRNNEIKVPKTVYDSYVNAFVNQLTEILEGGQMTETQRVETTDNMRDIYIEMYSYLKNVWDKWLVTAESDYYDTRRFFDNDFIFIDSFYQKIYDKLPINCSILYDIKETGSKEITLFTFINSLVTRHHCVFFALPDYIGFGKTRREDAETLATLFKPIPYNEMDGTLSLSNKFVVIWVNPQSVHNGWSGEYADDSFDICSFKSDTNERAKSKLPAVFTKTCFPEGDEGDEATRQGYNVPAFGVAFARQNNTIFKGIKVSMKNPVITSASAEMLSHIVEKGNQNPTKFYQGQDMYGSVFSNYSYECEVEMMGNAQICPLMYFQLLNVPMWRGAYMVFKVKHSMSKNNMTTTFVGMKMGSKAVPFPTNYLNTSVGGAGGSLNGTSYGTTYTFNAGTAGDITLEPNYNKYLVYNTANDHYRNKENHSGTVSFNTGTEQDRILGTIFNNLFETIKALPENQGDKRWNILLSSVYRPSGRSGSDHYTGNAMDLVIQYFDKDWKPTSKTSAGSERAQLFKAADIIYKHFWGHGKMQLIIEYAGSIDTALSSGGNAWMKLNCLHLSVQSKGSSKVWMCGNSGQKGSGRDISVANFLKYAPAPFKYTAGGAYHNNKTMFNSLFVNYNGASEDELKQHFGGFGGGSGDFNAWWEWTKTWEGKTISNYWVNGDTWDDYYGITKVARESFAKKTGRDARTTKAVDIARWMWEDKYKLNQIEDGKVAMLVMYTKYQTGNFGVVINALRGSTYEYVAFPNSKGPGKLTEDDFAAINNSNGAELFGKILDEFKNLHEYWGNHGGGKYANGWRNRRNSISYQSEWTGNK